MSGHSGRCFRQWRRTKQRKERQGKEWNYPMRWKVPLAVRPFLSTHGAPRQVRATLEPMGRAIAAYAAFQQTTGIGKPIRAGQRGR